MSPLLSTPLSWWSLTWPRTVELDDLTAALRQVAGSRQVPVLLRAEGSRGAVRHLVGAGNKSPAVQLRQHLAGAVTAEAEPLVADEQTLLLYLRFSTRQRAVRADISAPAVAGLLRALARAQRDEFLVLEWLLLSPLVAMAVPGQVDVAAERWGSLLTGSSGRVDAATRRALADKRGEPGWRAVGRLAVRAASPGRRRALLAGVLAALRAMESPGLRLQARRGRRAALGTASALASRPATLSVLEVPLLAAWPQGDVRWLPVHHQPSRHLPAHRAMPAYQEDSAQRLVAVGRRGSAERALVLPVADADRHLHVIGPTGSGKSTLLLRLIEADMAAGHSVVVLDPKGDLVADVLARVPEGRRDDVVLVDPTSERPVGLNPLAAEGDPELLADGLLGTLHELFASSWGIRTQDALSAALVSLARQEQASLALLPVLLTNAAYRRQVTAGLDDPLGVGAFWSQFEAMSESERRTATAPVANKLRQVLNRSALRAMVGQLTPRFELSEAFSSPKVVLVNLAKGLLGPEGSALLGALVWSRLWQAALAQTRLPAGQRRPVLVVADEFQDFLKLPVSFTDMLVQARSLGLGLTLAHQHLGQLSSEVREAVLSNAGSRVVFQVLDRDASVLARAGGELAPEDLTGLAAYEVYASLRVRSESTGWMWGRTLPPSPAHADPGRLRRASAERYGVPRDETEAALRAMLDGPDDSLQAPVGVKRRRGGAR